MNLFDDKLIENANILSQLLLYIKMRLKNLEKDKKYFLTIGVPIYIFLIVFFATHYFQITVFFLFILGIGFLGILRKKKVWLRLIKISFLTLLIYFIFFYNVPHLPSQFARRLPGARNNLLEPDNANIIQFKTDFYAWHQIKYSSSFDSLNESTRDELDFKLNRVDYYIRTVRMEYTYDTNAPYYYYDHLPTIDEVFTSDSDGDGKLQDDCDGITFLTASLLINMGYRVYVAEVEFHYHTKVFMPGVDPKTEAGYVLAINIYNSRNKPAYILFNQTETFIPPTRPILLSALDVLTGTSMYENYFLGFFQGKYFKIDFIFMIPLSYVLLFAMAFLLTIFMKIGESLKDVEKKTRRRKIFKTSIGTSIILSFGIFILYMVSVSGFGGLGNLILGTTLVASFRFSDHGIGKIKEPVKDETVKKKLIKKNNNNNNNKNK